MSKRAALWVGAVGAVLCASTDITAAPLGTMLTYQGQMTDAGSPANATYDFRFRLYNVLTDGNINSDSHYRIAGERVLATLDPNNIYLELQTGLHNTGPRKIFIGNNEGMVNQNGSNIF